MTKKKNSETGKTQIRIWPGVLVIAGCAAAVFLLICLLSYRFGLLTLPDSISWLDGVSRKNTNRSDTSSLEAESGKEGKETEAVYFTPEEKSPKEWLETLSVPETYFQRMRFQYVNGADAMEQVVECTVSGESFRIQWYDSTQTLVRQVVCDGASVWDSASPNGSHSLGETGQFGVSTLLGLPALGTLCATEQGRSLTFDAENKAILFRAPWTEEATLSCMISIDTGLITEMELRYGEMPDGVVIRMYTTKTDIAPSMDSTDFQIPKSGGTLS